jgi:LPXTG-motif cell wall-anchored protein
MPLNSAPPERGDSLPPEMFTPVPEHAAVPAAGSGWLWLAAIGAAATGALAAALIFSRRRRSRGIPSGRVLPH